MLDDISRKLENNAQEIIEVWVKKVQVDLGMTAEELFPSDAYLNAANSVVTGLALVLRDKSNLELFAEGGPIYEGTLALGRLRESQGFKMSEVCTESLRLRDEIWDFCNRHDVDESDLANVFERINLIMSRLLITVIESFDEQLTERQESGAVIDKVTRLYNRRFFQEQLTLEADRSRRHNQPLSLLLIDVDYFRSCINSYGKAQGDMLLRIYATVIKQNSRASDLLCRCSDGDEFSVLLPQTGKEEAEEAAHRLRKAIEDLNLNIQVGGEKRPLTVSIGCVTMPDDAKSAEDLLYMADEALYYAKKSGRNRCYCHPGAAKQRSQG